MIIKKITIKRFRAIRDEKTLEFAPGLNIIKGSDNEAGKSSLRMAITKALFQDPTSKRREIEDLTSWGTDEPWEISLECSVNSESYTITKNFKDKTCELICTGPHEFIAKNKDTIAKKIAELTGCPNEIFYESTACIGQDELIRLIPESASDSEKQSALGSITKRLHSKLSGVEDIDLPALLAKLYSKTHHKDADGPYSHLRRITERIGVLRSQKHEQESKNTDILGKRQKLAQSREELEKICPDLVAKQELLLKNRRIAELQKEIDRDKDLYNSFQRARELKSQIDRLEDELKPLAAFNGAEEQIKEIAVIEVKLDELPLKRTELQGELRLVKTQKPPPAAVISGLVLILAGLIALFVNPYSWIAAIAGLLPCAYWGINWRVWKKQLGSVSQRIDILEGTAGSMESELRTLLKQLGQQSYEDYQDSLAQFRDKSASKRDFSNRFEALIAGKEWKVFLEEREELNIRISAGIREIEQLKSFKLEPLALQKLEGDIKELNIRKSELELEKGGLERFFFYTDAEKDQTVEIDESLTALEEEKNFWENKRAVYDLTHEILEMAHKQTLAKAADLLEEEISRDMALLTDGRYNRVALSETDLSIRTFSPLKNDWVDVEKLSRATQDQFYICARLALARLITEGKAPPILLDDPFINFHSSRLRKMMSLLQQISRDTQVLLFTCSDSYDFMGKVISVN